MKNIIKLLPTVFLLIMTINCAAQHTIDPEADKFAGTWKWGDDVNGLVIIMKKENNMKIFGNDKPQRMDAILGFHTLVKNGLVVDDFLSFSNTNYEDKKRSFLGVTDVHTPNPYLLFTWGRHKGKSIEMTI